MTMRRVLSKKKDKVILAMGEYIRSGIERALLLAHPLVRPQNMPNDFPYAQMGERKSIGRCGYDCINHLVPRPGICCLDHGSMKVSWYSASRHVLSWPRLLSLRYRNTGHSSE